MYHGMTIDLTHTDPILRGRIAKATRQISDALIWLGEDLERAEKRADTYLDTLADELIVTRLFCGVAFAAAQAMIDGTREAP